MKSYRTLAFKELLAQKMTSFLILAAIILSTAMTTVIGQSAGVLSAMRQQQAIALGGDRYATFVQMNEEQTEALQNDPRLSYTGVSVSLGTVELSRALHLDLIEFRDGSGEIFAILYAATGRKAAGTGDGNRAAGGCAASDGG